MEFAGVYLACEKRVGPKEDGTCQALHTDYNEQDVSHFGEIGMLYRLCFEVRWVTYLHPIVMVS
jgi:hypothetical protein